MHQSELKRSLIDLITQVLRENGVTQERLAELAGITSSHLSQFLSADYDKGISDKNAINLIRAVQTIDPMLSRKVN